MDSLHALTKRWNAPAEIDCLGGTDEFNRCKSQREPGLLIKTTKEKA
jgi:hypothetical protein